MQHMHNANAEADIVFMRNQLRLAQECTRRSVEFVVVPLIGLTEKEARIHIAVSDKLAEAFGVKPCVNRK